MTTNAINGTNGTKHVNETSSPSTDILTLALDIVDNAANIKTLLASQGLPSPSFEPDSAEIPDTPEQAALRSRLVASLDDLKLLVVGPRRTVRSLICFSNDLAAFQVAFEFGFFTIVPESEDGIAVEKIARQAGMDASRARQVLRLLCTHRVFREVKEGWFAHTAMSAVFKRDENLRAAGHFGMDEIFKAASSTSDTIKASPHKSDVEHSPFRTRLGASMFEYYEQHPDHAARFAKAMAVDRKPSALADLFPWDTLNGTVVDVGGGSGHIAIALAHRFPHLNFLVQDGVPDMLVQGRRLLEAEDPAVAGRIELLEQDFFKPQPPPERLTTRGPVAGFFLRHVFHNWSDADSVRIARALVPALEAAAPETPLIISDRVLPSLGSGVPLHEERGMRQMDVMMMVELGAKERTKVEWEALFKAADERLVVKKVHGQGASSIVEVVLRK
ncbi:O-methyltransferase [Mytilinidion resinicola]|uniref:O-methyltransferase n=1 Tax=Mytilinidion resinicola TaxID=574789 RepID=A0A6A6Y7G3_9PEZI|nr:O-methyltransferase [Mytilinidion resinicola]KAF2804125.1 O-methyltransferase [Mytilinidion resinicola]